MTTIQKVSNNIHHPSTQIVPNNNRSTRAFAHLWTYYKDAQPELYTRCSKPILEEVQSSKLSCLLKKITKPWFYCQQQKDNQERTRKPLLERIFSRQKTLTFGPEDFDSSLESSTSSLSLSLSSEDSYIDKDALLELNF
ncbi:MAG: hypothetical protein ACSNEK_00530 [Parachlamydiaceae bacterium]